MMVGGKELALDSNFCVAANNPCHVVILSYHILPKGTSEDFYRELLELRHPSTMAEIHDQFDTILILDFGSQVCIFIYENAIVCADVASVQPSHNSTMS